VNLMPISTPQRTEIATTLGTSIEVSVVIPCLNEARTVGRCIEKARAALGRLGVVGEVVVADNGSADGSREIARNLGVRVVEVEGRGYGSALRGGIEASSGQLIIMGDADDSYDFAGIGPFVDRLRAGDELVMGNRFRGGIMPGAMPWHHRYIGNPALTGVLNLFFRSPIGDAHCGLRGFRREAYDRLRLSSSGMEFASEMVVKACLNRLRISEIPVVLHPDGRDRRPHLRSFRDGWRHLRLLLLLCPTWLFLIPAGLLVGAGLGLMIWLTPGSRRVGHVGLDVHMMLLGALWVLMGHQLAWMWAHAKAHGWATGILPDEPARAVIDRVELEHGLAVGVALLLAGLGSNFCLIAEWHARDFGPLEARATLRYAFWGLTAMILGTQAICGSFLLVMLRMAPEASRPGRLSGSLKLSTEVSSPSPPVNL
jgi:hypothetical protein